MAHQEQSLPQSMQQSSSSIPIDPALALYPPYYSQHNISQQPSHHLPPHLSLPPNYSSPSSQGSDTIGTPPTEVAYPHPASAANGKRPASSVSADAMGDARKKLRRDDASDAKSPATDKEEVKTKPTRGSRACTVCRRLKMKCVGAEHGPPCKRCLTGNHECIFEESNRGKRTSKKHELLTRSLRKMEKTLDTVLRSIGNPTIASGMVSRSPSPSAQTATTQALLGSPTPPPAPSTFSQTHHSTGSPKLHSLPDNSLNPLGLLAEASLANRRAQATLPNLGLVARSTEPGDKPKIGVASANYFKPGPMTILPLRRLYIERQVQPEMLSFVSTEEVVTLFNIYFDHINPHCSLLDRTFHTPSLVCSRSPFLLTAICSISSKFYTTKPELHPRLTELAKKLAFSVPAKGYKSVEIVQAYLLLSLFGCGAVERYEQDKTWLLLGMAIRMATDLNLHRKTAVASADNSEGRARDAEVHNRERTWILCFCLDRSFSAQMGKPYSIKEDYIIRNAAQWARSSAAIPSDSSLAAYAELQRILSRSLDFLYSATDSASGLQGHCDYLLVIKTFETQIIMWRQQWESMRTWELGEPASVIEYKRLIAQFYFHYALLVLNSFGLQNALERSSIDIGHFFARCHTSATACATLVRDHLGPSGYLKYSPDSHFVQTSYAVLTLLKLVRPEFQAFLDNEQGTLTLVNDIANTLESIAANPLHTPNLYSVFLRALISARLDTKTINGTKEEARGSNLDQSQGIGDVPPSQLSHSAAYQGEPGFLAEFQFDGEMGPVADMSVFPPTMAPLPAEDTSGGLSMDNILGAGFWDSVLVPGYNSTDGLTGGFVFGAGGSGIITPHLGVSPIPSGTNTPARGAAQNHLTQLSINAAFTNGQIQEGLKIDS
ncbi:hypothetical protein AMATHDRAFT_74760 [Amanita thiersii Skay4041]|uniref:Zn(2)-C6 fungal-type domain-containing protein n=1 Tax=Amanita thiersii Skay4041 TaxID=703135 RepID=A0A2A9NNN5_9AGAR|nr:hypothetical protein AMATHDRAFT_74760 [Amanita thiersii Skay4041]